MNSSKSANLLMMKHNYEEQGFKVLLLKPAVDTREGEHEVVSRVGISAPCTVFRCLADIVFDPDYDVIMVDEAQFLSREDVKILYNLSFDKVVMCFGLLRDFRRRLFEGSEALVELCDSLHEIKSVCRCGKRAEFNARFESGVLVTEGSQILIGGNEEYQALCKDCYEEELMKANKLRQE